jgi:hypothetical protein
VNLDALLLLDLAPLLLELFLHFTPDLQGLLLKLLDSQLCRFLKLIQSVPSLNDSGFFHKEFELGISRVGFEPAVSFLDVQSCQDRALRSLKFLFRVVDGLPNLLLVDDAREEVLICHNIEFLIRVVQHLQAVDMRESYIELANVLLKVVNDLLDCTPASDVSSLETDKLLLTVQHLALLDDKLRLVHISPSSITILMKSVSVLVRKRILIVIKVLLCFEASHTTGFR